MPDPSALQKESSAISTAQVAEEGGAMEDAKPRRCGVCCRRPAREELYEDMDWGKDGNKLTRSTLRRLMTQTSLSSSRFGRTSRFSRHTAVTREVLNSYLESDRVVEGVDDSDRTDYDPYTKKRSMRSLKVLNIFFRF